jgi:hypothetical protein
VDVPSAFAVITMFSYVALVFLVAWVAGQRGQNAALWYLLALFTSPIVAGLLLLVITSPRRVD